MYQVFLPGILLLMAFMLKLVVDRRAELPDVLRAILELPVDVVFLATSFVVGFTLGNADRLQQGLLLFTCYLLGAIIIVILWRRSEHMFVRDKFTWMIVLAALNYCLCVIGLIYAVRLIVEGGTA